MAYLPAALGRILALGFQSPPPKPVSNRPAQLRPARRNAAPRPAPSRSRPPA